MKKVIIGIGFCVLLSIGSAGAVPDQTVVGQGTGSYTLNDGVATITCTANIVASFIARSGTWSLTETWGPGSNNGTPQQKAACAVDGPLGSATNAAMPVHLCQSVAGSTIGIDIYRPYTLTGLGTAASPYIAQASSTTCDGKHTATDKITFTVGPSMSFKHDYVEDGLTIVHATATLARVV